MDLSEWLHPALLPDNGMTENGKQIMAQLEKGKKDAEKRHRAKAKDLTRAKILEALAAAGNITEAAELAGVSRKTIYSYMNTDSDFITAYRDMKRGQIRDMAETINRGAERAASYIAGLLDDTEAPHNVKLSAAVKLLEIGARYRDTETAIDGATLKELQPFTFFDTSPV